MFGRALGNGIFQVVLFTLIPFIWWIITARKKEKFFLWLGIKKPAVANGKWVLFMFLVGGVCLGLGEVSMCFMGSLQAVESQYKGMGIAAIPSVLVYSFIQTALSEEILFRGFLLKRLVSTLGFERGTMIQAVLFGVIHFIGVWGQVDFIAGFVIIVYPMVIAVILAYINEKMSDGSILPSWIIHGLLNTITGIMAAIHN